MLSPGYCVAELIDLLLHVDRYLLRSVDQYGAWIYAILFVIVFAETGLVVTPFLPGDSLLFAAGALAATGALDGWLLFGLLVIAAVAGNAVNYAIGRAARASGSIERARTDPRWGRWINPTTSPRATTSSSARRQGRRAGPVHADRAHVRPVRRRRRRDVVPAFALYNVIGRRRLGGVLHRRRISVRQRARRQDNFSLVAIGIVVVSLLPAVIAWLRAPRRAAP